MSFMSVEIKQRTQVRIVMMESIMGNSISVILPVMESLHLSVVMLS